MKIPKIPSDKFAHFFYCFCIFLAITALASEFSAPVWSIVIGTILTSLIGVGKEWYDFKNGGIFSFPDLVADFIGIIVAMPIYLLLVMFF